MATAPDLLTAAKGEFDRAMQRNLKGLSYFTTSGPTLGASVKDVLIAGLGDSIASGEGNPDRPVTLADGGFCFRRFLGSSLSEYFRPSRAGFQGDKACPESPASATAAEEWQRSASRWMSAARCALTPTPGAFLGQEVTIVHCWRPCEIAGAGKEDAAPSAAAPPNGST